MNRLTRLLLALALTVGLAIPASAQFTVPHTFSAGQLIDATKFNANFDEIEVKALNRTGGTITGAIAVDSGITIDGVDLSAVLGGTGTPTFAAVATGTLTTTGLATLNSLAVTTSATIGTTLTTSGLATLNSLVVDTSATAVSLSTNTLNVNTTSTFTGVPTFNASAVFTALPGVNNITPGIFFRESGVAANNGRWLVFADGTQFLLATVTDSDVFSAAAWVTSRSGTTVTGTQFTGTVAASTGFIGSGASLTALNATQLTTGTVADARLSSNVALLADDETISGNWFFNNTIQVPVGSAADPALSFGAGSLGWHAQSTGPVVLLSLNGVSRIRFGEEVAGDEAFMDIPNSANGVGPVTGNYIIIGANASGGSAAGFLSFINKAGGQRSIWIDAADQVRTRLGGGPTEDNTTVSDTSGTVVGTQVSQRSTKNIYGEFIDYESALKTLLQTPLWNFDYKSGAYNHQQFVGITTDDSPVFGMDEGRSFNPVTAFGYTVAAFKAQDARIRDLEARIKLLEQLAHFQQEHNHN